MRSKEISDNSSDNRGHVKGNLSSTYNRRTYECDVGDHNPYRTYLIFGIGPFATREEATEEAKEYQPQHGDLLLSNANWPTRKPRQSETQEETIKALGNQTLDPCTQRVHTNAYLARLACLAQHK